MTAFFRAYAVAIPQAEQNFAPGGARPLLGRGADYAPALPVSRKRSTPANPV